MSKINPADLASRGVAIDRDVWLNKWIRAPSFLHKAKSERMKTPDDSCKSLFENDPEIKKVKVSRVDAKPVGNNYEGDVLVNNLLERYSSCNKGIAWIFHGKFVESFLRSVSNNC